MGKTENQPRATVRRIPIISLLLLLLASLPTQGRRLDVGPGKAYVSIAKALAAATDGVRVSGYLTGYEMALLHLMRKRKDRQPLLPAFVCRKRKVFEGLLYPAPQPKQAPQPPLPHVTREVFAPPAATQPEIVVKNE